MAGALRPRRVGGFTVRRGLSEGIYALSEVAVGLENSPVLKSLFGGHEENRRVVEETQVKLRKRGGYMHIDDEDRSIVASLDYVNQGDERDLYLDFVHELTHIKQLMEGRQLFEPGFEYVDRPTELEAYSVVVKEGRRLGMTWEEIRDYLYAEWMNREEFMRLLRNLGVSISG